MHQTDDSIYQDTFADSATEEEYLRLPCFVHCLQLIVNDGINANTAAVSSIEKVASLVKLLHTSTAVSEQLGNYNYTISSANHTRWNSRFRSVRKVIEIPTSILNATLTALKKK